MTDKNIYLYDEEDLLIERDKAFINPRNPDDVFIPSNPSLVIPPNYNTQKEYIKFNKK